MNWLEVKVKTRDEFEDMIINTLYEFGAEGLEIEDPKDISQLSQSKASWDFIDPKLIKLEIQELWIKAYFPKDEEANEKIKKLKEIINSRYNPDKSQGIVFTSTIDDQDWSHNWKKYYKPTRIGKNILIKPSWEEIEKKESDILIELDPGMAFGTGTHETTIMCSEALEEYLEKGDLVYDIGCGSGILSIVAAKLGAKKVLGIDLDEDCIRVSKENIKINSVEELVDIKKGDLFEVVSGKADIIVANIIAQIIATMAKDLKSYLKKDGIFISSGIIKGKMDLVVDALEGEGFKILDIKKKDDWCAIIAKKE